MKSIVLVFILLLPTLSWATSPGKKAVTESYADWQINCIKEGGETACELFAVAVNEQQKPILRMSFISVNKETNNDLLRVVLPLYVDLTKPLDLQIEDRVVGTLEYQFCSPEGCVLQASGTGLLPNYRASKQVSMVFSSYAVGLATAVISLDGFTSAHKRFVELTDTGL